MLAEHGDNVRPTVQIRALRAMAGDTLNGVLGSLDELVDIAIAHRRFDTRQEGPVAVAYRRAQDLDAILWAVRLLVEGGRLAEATRLLDAWAPADRPGKLLDGPVFMLPTHPVGTLWAAGNSVAPDPLGPEANTLDVFQAAAVAALRASIPLRGHEALRDRDPRELGLPDADSSRPFAERGRAHLRLEELASLRHELDERSALIALPPTYLPVQAHLVRELGLVVPMSASLRVSEACRPLRRVVVMGAGSQSAERERQAVEAVFRSGGVDVQAVFEATAPAFTAAYADPDVDAVWLCSHGKYDHLRPHHSGLELDDGTLLTLEALHALSTPATPGSRLLMLNVCDAAASAQLGGPMALGVAAVLAGHRQTVISHLWPVEPLPAAVFGLLIAAALVRDGNHCRAFGEALGTLGAGKSAILARLAELDSAAEQLRSSVLNSDSIRWEAITTWGSPALVLSRGRGRARDAVQR